nr:hypothetical protein [Tanacetum cinerariifolium]
VHTKFVNHLQPEWSRFVTGVKQARNLHNVSFDQLYAYLKQNEANTSEVYAMRARFPDPIAFITNTYNPPLSYSSYTSQYSLPVQAAPQQQMYLPQLTYEPPAVHQQPPPRPTSLHSRFVVPTLLPNADPIARCDEAPTASVIFMERLSPTRSVNEDDAGPSYETNILSKVPNYDKYHDNDMFHPYIQELDYFEQPTSINDTYVELTNDSNVIFDIPYADNNANNVAQDMNSLAQNDGVILYIIDNMQHEVTRCSTVNQETKQVNESLTIELESYNEKVKFLEQTEPQLVFTSKETDLDSQIRKKLLIILKKWKL